MTDPQRIFSLATILGAAGLWLLLPRGLARGRAAGAVLALAGAGVWASQLPCLGDWLASSLFFVMAGVTILAAICTVTFRSPVYCAIWFGMTLVGTAGLFLLAGSEFLAVATLVVYAGAILVTFLFVIMLSQPEGHTSYDRQSWEALLAAATGGVMIGILSMTLGSVFNSTGQGGVSVVAASEEAMASGVLAPDRIARLGADLFTRNLIAVEVAGTMLFAALVGAAIIVAQGRKGSAANNHFSPPEKE